MKILILLIFITFFTSHNSQAQGHNRPPGKMPERLQQLEKIKLIETLEMDEETTLKFFARRTEHQKVVDELSKEADDVIKQIESILSGEHEASETELKELIKNVNSIRTEIEQSKTNFILSLDDLLSTEQIAKLIVFERRFRDELRDVLFRERMFRKRN